MIKIGTSACVMGEKVRYDGGHKRSAFVMTQISEHYKLVPFCPEIGIGMSAPRPAIQLREINGELALVDSKTGLQDHTDSMGDYFRKNEQKLASLDGYIVAGKSPSCGMERIKVHDATGKQLRKDGVGVFTNHLKTRFPYLPVEEDGRLNDKGIRESFFSRLHAYAAFKREVLSELTPASLVDFHTRFKYLVLAYCPKTYYELGPLVAGSGSVNDTADFEALATNYLGKLMHAMSRTTSRKKHTNVLMHLQGFFKRELNSQSKQELTKTIDNFYQGYVPLLAPLTLINHYLMEFPNPFLKKQVYLQPFPLELGIYA